MKRDISYQVAISTFKQMYDKGLITNKEMLSLESSLREKYNPTCPVLSLNHYFFASQNDHLTLSRSRGNVTSEGE